MAQSITAVPVAHRSKTIAAWLAFLLGVFGAHAWYMRRSWAWLWTAFTVLMLGLMLLYPVWWDCPPFLVLIVPCTAGFIEALIFALKPDDKFDAKYNAGSGKVTQTGWGPVMAAILTTFFGGTVTMIGLALIVMHVYTAMGWLDGYVF